MSERKSGAQVMYCAVEFKLAKDEAAPGTFEGYASVFNNEDCNGDVMMPGAFALTLARFKSAGKRPKMLLNHGGLGGWGMPDPEDLLPIGKWEQMSEDSTGLNVQGRLINLDTERGKSIYGAMKEGELDSMSIAYIARDYEFGVNDNEPYRWLKAVDLIEAGPVTFPANDLATIGGVKSIGRFSKDDWRDLEASLRDEGLSRADAVKAVSGFKSYLRRDGGDPEQGQRDAATSDDIGSLIESIRAAAKVA